jgi:uncharacterized protein (TIGR00251 family)
MTWYRWIDNKTLILDLRIQPRAKQNEIADIMANRLRIRIKSPPVDGKANNALVKFLAQQFGVAAAKVELISGQNKRDKRFAIHSPATQPEWFLSLIKQTDQNGTS